MLHKNVLLGDRHPVHDWEVADPAALAALVVTSADVGKVAKQLAPLRFFMLANETGPVWFEASWSATLAASITAYVDAEIDALAAASTLAYQPLDAQLTSLAGLAYAGNTLKGIRVNAAETGFELATISGGSSGREVLTAARTYYVRTDGSDSNNGLTNTSGGAFLTIQKAYLAAAALDFAGYAVTIQVADGTYAAGISASGSLLLSGGSLTITGNAGAPANVIIGSSSAAQGAAYTISNLKINAGASSFCLYANTNGYINFSNIVFGTCAAAHMRAAQGGILTASGNYSIVNAAPLHLQAITTGIIVINNRTVTITGTLAFSTAYAAADTGGSMELYNNTYSGSTTGPRYACTMNGTIQTYTGNAFLLPGNSNGSTATGGQYA